MADGRRGAALDLFRLAAVVLVVRNSTPLGIRTLFMPSTNSWLVTMFQKS